ncbi:MAG: Fpg/Nei family DNA glycosylase [Dermatophilaceae bacterium]
MPEGHTVHALAARLGDAIVGEPVRASSPQGRFADGAVRLDRGVPESVDAWGKHLIVRMTREPLVLHVHLGLFGRYSVQRHRRRETGEPPTDLPVRGAVRLRLTTGTHVADLRGATACELLDPPALDALLARLGPDPIRDDADGDLAWARLSRSRRPLAALLMDQSVVAGIGNVYRAELLHRAALDPFVPGRDLDRGAWERLWRDTCDLMAVGAATGRIVTDDAELATARGLLVRGEPVPRWRPRYAVYRRSGRPCPRCGAVVIREDLSGRALHWCPGCQTLGRTAPLPERLR